LKREILINGSQRETRVAILEDDRLVELLVDRPDHRRTVGDIYLGRVEAVLPGIQAAFVDIGQEKSAFLHASDLLEPDEDEDPIEEAEDGAADETDAAEGAEAAVTEDPPAERKAGWRSQDRRRRGRGNGSAAAMERTGERPVQSGEARQREISSRRALPNIQDILKKGQTLPVQVTKEPISTKGCRVTAQISLPGRFLVYMPYASKVGVSRKIESLLAVLGEYPNLRVDRIKAEAIRSGRLEGYDVLIQPGGSGGTQGKTLGEEGREEVRSFVRGGGGYLGICAGAYLATRDYPWSLHILDAKVVDRQHWARGSGDVDITLTTTGRDILGAETERPAILYYQGPLLAPGDDPEIPDYEVLARFDGEIARNGAPKGVMRGTTAIAAAPYESGRVLCFSPHPERTAHLHDMVYRAILWTAGKSPGQR